MLPQASSTTALHGAMIDIENLHDHLERPCPFTNETSCANCELGQECLEHVQRQLGRASLSGSKELLQEASTVTSEPEVPCVIQESHFTNLLHRATEDLDANPDFEAVHVGEVLMYQHRVDSTTWEGRATVQIPCTANEALEAFWDLETRQRWDTVFDELRVVESFSASPCGIPYDIVYMAVETPPMIAPRDFIQSRAKRVLPDQNACAAVFLPAEHDKVPPREGYVRGKVIFSGIYIKDRVDTDEEGRESCDFTMLSTTSFGVPIPMWLMRKVIKYAIPIYMRSIRQSLDFLKLEKLKAQGDEEETSSS